MDHPCRHLWGLNPDIDFLNHGSFGATPLSVLRNQQEWINQLEQDPIEFLAPERGLLPKLDRVRRCVAKRISAPANDIAFVRNATDGVNAVVGSFPFRPGDEVVITNHGYNACNNAVKFAADRAGASVVVAEIPFPIRSADQIIDAIEARLTSRTRLLIVDHVTSPTAIIFPVEDLVDLAHRRGVRIMIDGAHATGMLPLDLNKLPADYYTANHHKWLCAPKTSGLLHVQTHLQNEVRPCVISHGANTDGLGESRFLAEFNWTGTYDPAPLLALPAAIEFLDSLGKDLMTNNRELAIDGRNELLDRLGIDEPAPTTMLGSMATIPIPGWKTTPDRLRQVQQQLYDHHRIEVPIFQLSDATTCIRISAQAYNHIDQYERLADVLVQIAGQ